MCIRDRLYVYLDREQARTLGVPVETIFGTLQVLFGSAYISQFNLYSQVWQVIVQAAPEYRSRPDDIQKVYVRSNNPSSGNTGVMPMPNSASSTGMANMVPLASVVRLEYTNAPNLISRCLLYTSRSARTTPPSLNRFRSATGMATSGSLSPACTPAIGSW